MLPGVSSSLHLPPKWHEQKTMEQPNSLKRWGAQTSAFFRATFLRGLPPASSLSGRGKASPSEVSEELSSSCSSTDGNLVMWNNILITKNVSKWPFPKAKSINSSSRTYYENTLMVLPVTALSCFVPVTAGWPEFVSQIKNLVSNSGKLTEVFHSWKASYTSHMQATASSFCRSCSCNSACRWQVVSVLGLQVVCSHAFQVITYNIPQSVVSTCDQVHFESAKECPTILPKISFCISPGLLWFHCLVKSSNLSEMRKWAYFSLRSLCRPACFSLPFFRSLSSQLEQWKRGVRLSVLFLKAAIFADDYTC